VAGCGPALPLAPVPVPDVLPPPTQRLAPLTTLRLGGPARRFVEATSADAVVRAVRDADAAGEPMLLLGGGSNVVIADDGWPGTVVHVANTGRTVERRPDGSVLLTVEAGTDWDEVVAACVADGWGGLECLSGIPGRTGATPVQNVGAYGVEVADLLVDVDLYDRRADAVRSHVPAAELGLAYRTSVLKGRDDAVVLRVRFALPGTGAGAPVRYPELARTLGVELGAQVPAAVAREAVLDLRRGKGMVLDPDDHDTWSAGSFFTNPVLPEGQVPSEAPRFPAGPGSAKVPAAWLIEQSGFRRGHPGPGGRVALSGKHVLALTNRGGGTTVGLLALAREVRDGVRSQWGVTLSPEPVLVGCTI
jgi:UDP-N-acetylmuramate dehydrogenase